MNSGSCAVLRSVNHWRWMPLVMALGRFAVHSSAVLADEPVEKTPLPADAPAAAADLEPADAEKQNAGERRSPKAPAAPAAAFPVFRQFGGFMPGMWNRNFFLPAGIPAADASGDDNETPRSVVLPENGDMRRRLERIRGLIAGQHFADAARQLGPLLQDPAISDFFLGRDGERRDGRSFRAEIRKLIGELPEEGRTAYVLQFEAVARQQLTAALEGGGEAPLREVVRRFAFTPAGNEALYRLGHFLSDHGRPEAAVACLERLRSEAGSAGPFEAGAARLLDACRRRLADAGASRAVADWTVHRGNPARNRSSAARAPLLAARWTHEVAAEPHTRMAIDRSIEAHREGRETHVPLLNPLAVGDLVLMRTVRGVAAFDLATGSRLWQHPSDDDTENGGIERLLWRDPAGGALAADAECFYLLEGQRAGDDESSGGAQAVLTAREHFRSREGRLRWQVGGAGGGAAPVLAGAVFLGPPLPWQGRLYAQVERNGAIALVVLDAGTGRLEWSLELALVESAAGTDPLRRLAGATPSIAAEEIVVCPTSGGAIVAVDLTTQSLLWAYRYSRRSPTDGEEVDGAAASPILPRFDQQERWLDSTITIGADCAVFGPPESGELHCLDLRDGHLRWTQPRGDGLFVACLADGAAIVAGKSHVRAWNLADGKPVWTAPLELPLRAFTSGRGLFAGARYFLPVTTGGIVEIDLAQGLIVGEYRTVRETAPGNLIWHKGSFVSLGPDYIQAFDEREAVEREVADILARDPRDATALLRRGELELSAGRLEEALAAFRQAHAARPGSRTRSLLTSALLDAVRRESFDREALTAELDGLAIE